MLFVYIDDFGHPGPYFNRNHPRHNTSPVFGYAGFALPEQHVRAFSSFFLQLKGHNLAHEAERASKPIYKWEKKGTNLFTKNSIDRYPSVRQMAFRLMDEIHQRGGFIFYHGKEKFKEVENLNPVGLQTAMLSKAIRKLDKAAWRVDARFAIVMDQSSSRTELLECAQKTMFGEHPCRKMVSPPFEVESHLDQNMQAADWIATIVGRIYAAEYDPEGFQGYESYDKYFRERLGRVARFSSCSPRGAHNPHAARQPLAIAHSEAVVVEQTVIETVVETRTVSVLRST